MGTEKFCLRWNDFESNISVAFRELREDKDFFDITLACEDEQLSAHKVILSACSPLFRNLLRRNPHQHPLLYLKSVRYTDLQAVLNFMYNGEVNVAQEELNSFLAVAEELQVKGLTQSHSQNKSQSPKSTPKSRQTLENMNSSNSKRFQSNTSQQRKNFDVNVDDDEIQEVLPVKTEPGDHTQSSMAPLPSYTTDVSNPSSSMGSLQNPTSQSHMVANIEDSSLSQYNEQFDEYSQYDEQNYSMGLDSSMSGAGENKGGGNYNFKSQEDFDMFVTREGPVCVCTLCGVFRNKTITNVRCHIESKHFPGTFTYSCPICGKQCNSKTSLRDHNSFCKKVHQNLAGY